MATLLGPVRYMEEARLLARASGDRYTEALALLISGLVAVGAAELDQANDYLQASLRLFDGEGSDRWRPYVLKNLGFVAYKRGDYASADALFNQALGEFRALGNSYGTAITLINMGRIARDQRELTTAANCYAEALALCWDQGDKVNIANCLRGMGNVAAQAGQFVRAVHLLGADQALRDSIGFGEPRSRIHIVARGELCQALGRIRVRTRMVIRLHA